MTDHVVSGDITFYTYRRLDAVELSDYEREPMVPARNHRHPQPALAVPSPPCRSGRRRNVISDQTLVRHAAPVTRANVNVIANVNVKRDDVNVNAKHDSTRGGGIRTLADLPQYPVLALRTHSRRPFRNWRSSR